jgi:CHAT domain-containing protein
LSRPDIRGLPIALLLGFLGTLPALAPLDGLGIDSLFWLRHQVYGPRHGPDQSPEVVVALDEETFRRPPFKSLPKVLWTPQLAQVINAARAGGAKVIGQDLILPTSVEGFLPGYDRDYLLALRAGGEAVLFASYRDVPWLARDHAISVLPSTTALNTLRRGERSVASQSFVGFGDPIFNLASAEQPLVSGDIETRGILDLRGLPTHLRSVPDTGDYVDADLSVLPRLPDTGEELRQIALALSADPSTQLFLGRDASEKRVRSMELSGYKILAFATHGLVPGDLNGLVEPALALSAPKEAGPEDDGLLTMSEILGLRLDADWVVLSACNTGAGDGAGAEAVSGLGRAFFYAGSRALLVTNWPVETTSARRLTSDIFARQAADGALSRAGALQGAMLALMDSPGYRDGAGKTLFSYAHPIFWAPFSLIGDGG